MKEYEKHVTNVRASNILGYQISYCDERLEGDWAFISIDHAVGTIQAQDRLLPCPKCQEKIIELLNTK